MSEPKNRLHPGTLWLHDLRYERAVNGHALFILVSDLKDELCRVNADQDELQETRDACADLFRLFFGQEMPD